MVTFTIVSPTSSSSPESAAGRRSGLLANVDRALGAPGPAGAARPRSAGASAAADRSFRAEAGSPSPGRRETAIRAVSSVMASCHCCGDPADCWARTSRWRRASGRAVGPADEAGTGDSPALLGPGCPEIGAWANARAAAARGVGDCPAASRLGPAPGTPAGRSASFCAGPDAGPGRPTAEEAAVTGAREVGPAVGAPPGRLGATTSSRTSSSQGRSHDDPAAGS